ncbi:MAG: hypothetical protein CVV59_00865 [Tenericutes bacterium HGW-Tenericutes-4]|nr:MAG: hypothetical protein CVV59_00865 [Tenericutes bacterium HGW-Tenericutes-4]
MNEIEIICDTFDIAKRLKQIDKNYVLVWNKAKQRYEVRYKTQNLLRLELVLPYSELDVRTINYINKTRVENHKALLKEMEENNLKLEKKAQENMLDEAQIKLKEISKYLSSKGEHSNYEHDKSYQTKWV